jgi:DNA polymerase
MSYEENIRILKWYASENIKEVLVEAINNENSIEKPNDKSISRILADEAHTIEELEAVVKNFDGCNLKKGAMKTVFADGNVLAPIMLIGEAPGATEDEKGIPFCGASGILLDNMLASIGISREKNAYITNCVFWRPPGNMCPSDADIEMCKPFLEKHIYLKNPKLLILVGSTAVSAFLGKQYQISKIRRQYFDYINPYLSSPIKVTAIFHPAYLLRQPLQKRTTWHDLLYIKNLLKDL